MLFTHATASRIKSYKDCQFRYFLEYMLQLPSMKGDNIYSGKGSAVHEALEGWTNWKLGVEKKEDGPIVEEDWEKTLIKYYSEHNLWSLDNRMPDKHGKPKGYPHPVEKTCESCQWASKDNDCLIANKPISVVEGCPRPNFQEDYDLIKKTFARTDYNPLALDEDGNFKKKILGAEYKFDMKLGGVRVKGVFDLPFEEDSDTIEICDYKTGRSMTYDKARVDPQVRTYGAAARIIWPQYKYVMVTLYYLKSGPVTVPLSAKDDEKTILSLQRAKKEIKKNTDPRRYKFWLCPYCVGYENCGTIQNNLRVDGRFKLPTIQCEYTGREPCYGNLHPIEHQIVTWDTAHKMKYTCRGHSEVPNGKEYIAEPIDSNKAS